MDDKKNEQIIVSDFDNDFWYELFDLQVMNIRQHIGELGGEHNSPHLHAKYDGYEVSVRISNSEIFAGNFLQKKQK